MIKSEAESRAIQPTHLCHQCVLAKRGSAGINSSVVPKPPPRNVLTNRPEGSFPHPVKAAEEVVYTILMPRPVVKTSLLKQVSPLPNLLADVTTSDATTEASVRSYSGSSSGTGSQSETDQTRGIDVFLPRFFHQKTIPGTNQPLKLLVTSSVGPSQPMSSDVASGRDADPIAQLADACTGPHPDACVGTADSPDPPMVRWETRHGFLGRRKRVLYYNTDLVCVLKARYLFGRRDPSHLANIADYANRYLKDQFPQASKHVLMELVYGSVVVASQQSDVDKSLIGTMRNYRVNKGIHRVHGLSEGRLRNNMSFWRRAFSSFGAANMLPENPKKA